MASATKERYMVLRLCIRNSDLVRQVMGVALCKWCLREDLQNDKELANKSLPLREGEQKRAPRQEEEQV